MSSALFTLGGAFALSMLLTVPAYAAASADDEKDDKSFSGHISWYGPGFNGRKTSSGEVFDMKKHTCAHKKLPFGTKILIENPRNGKSCVVKVNDRGPYAKGRIIDVSRGAAEKLGILLGGVAYVECTLLPAGGATPINMGTFMTPPL
ncbi:MAG: septal ring lytic transglycosylase RlpA family protein [Cyanobacteria bacterium]|nr:septal ring lytic transglycosylase RlpA family protein [Cyanobacteriota bacterium]